MVDGGEGGEGSQPGAAASRQHGHGAEAKIGGGCGKPPDRGGGHARDWHAAAQPEQEQPRQHVVYGQLQAAVDQAGEARDVATDEAR